VDHELEDLLAELPPKEAAFLTSVHARLKHDGEVKN
jgi:hypothetical protein